MPFWGLAASIAVAWRGSTGWETDGHTGGASSAATKVVLAGTAEPHGIARPGSMAPTCVVYAARSGFSVRSPRAAEGLTSAHFARTPDQNARFAKSADLGMERRPAARTQEAGS